MAATDWNPILRAQLSESYWAELQDFVRFERHRYRVYPEEADVFRALHLTPYSAVRAVILGQDPYHGPNQAHGLCFSVRSGIAIPPSLRNIFAERESDLGIPPPADGDLGAWGRQGVLLLNTTLTVREGQPASHHGRGWERFTDQVIQAVSAKTEPVVFILWGASARKKKVLVNTDRHFIIESAHPSPLSAHRGFFGSQPFSGTNQALKSAGRSPIDWHVGGDARE